MVILQFFKKVSWEKNSFCSDQDHVNENHEHEEQFKLFQIQAPHTCNLTCHDAFPRGLATLS